MAKIEASEQEYETAMAKKNLEIYSKVNHYINVGVVLPFEKEMIDYLATHTDEGTLRDTNYLDSLNSIYSIGNCFRYSRYVALAMNQPFKLCSGFLSTLHDGDFQHSWIETEYSVYDVTFTGKWPKGLYYELFKPSKVKVANLMTDQLYRVIKCRAVPATHISESQTLKEIAWFGYTDLNLAGYGIEEPWFYELPATQKRI